MAKQLVSLRWAPSWMSQMGCLQGCAEFLGSDVSRAWLYGATAQAFVINMHEEVCPSGPTAWDSGALVLRLARNLGLGAEAVRGHTGQPDFDQQQQAAWEFVRAGLDRNLPCYGWELGVPEYYVIHGYDAEGYHYRGPGADDGAGPKAWDSLGRTAIGALEVACVKLREAAPVSAAVKQALASALESAGAEAAWPGYFSGTRGFAVWAQALREGKASNFGHRYNAAVWAECRSFAAPFLREAGEKLGLRSEALDSAILHYRTAHLALDRASALHPFTHEPLPSDLLQNDEAAQLVTEAGAADAQGLGALERLIQEI